MFAFWFLRCTINGLFLNRLALFLSIWISWPNWTNQVSQTLTCTSEMMTAIGEQTIIFWADQDVLSWETNDINVSNNSCHSHHDAGSLKTLFINVSLVYVWRHLFVRAFVYCSRSEFNREFHFFKVWNIVLRDGKKLHLVPWYEGVSIRKILDNGH